MSRWKLKKKHAAGDPYAGPGLSASFDYVESPAPPPSTVSLEAAIEEMAHLRTVAEAGRRQDPEPNQEPDLDLSPEPEPALPGEVTADGALRLIRITGEIQALIEPESPASAEDNPEPEAAAASSPATQPPELDCASLPQASKVTFEILHPRCPPAWAEAFRKLRGRLAEEKARREAAGQRLNSVAVVSPRRSSGRSSTARNLAACLAVVPDTKVLLIDADIGRPSLHRRLRINQSPGLAETIAQPPGAGAGWPRHLQCVPDTGLYVLPLGSTAGTGIDALDLTLLPAFLDAASGTFPWVILDAPPLESADGEALATLTDGTLLVLRNEHEYFDEADAAVRRLDPARLVGAILNFA